MTFMEHLGELRTRLIWSVLAVAIGTGISFLYSRDLVNLFISLGKAANSKVEFTYTELLQSFSLYFVVSVYAGLLLASPVIVYHVIAFLAPALEPETRPGEAGHEEEVKVLNRIKRNLIVIIPGVAIFFAAGVTFSYYLLLPPAIRFLTHFPEDEIKPFLTATSFVGTITKIMFWTGVTFEIPIIMYAFAKTKIVTWKKLLGWWKFAIILSLIISAFINPNPDPISQLIIAGPVMLLYLLGVVFARLA